MSSATAPYPYFNGITYNPSFFSSTSSTSTGLTQSQADLLYLRKTTADTATATETFSKIYLTEADTPTPSVDFNLLTSETGNINIGTSVPALKTIKIGASTGTSVHCGSIDCTGTNINNAVSSGTGTISLGPAQTTGILNIGSHPTTATRTTGAINIGSNSIGVTPITIGTSGQSLITLNGPAVTISDKLIVPLINASTGGTDIDIGLTMDSGTLSIAAAQTTGTLNLGSGSRSTGPINIGNSCTGAVGITIGSNTSSTVLNGTSVQVTTKMTTPKIESLSATTNIEIGNNQTSGLINIGTQNSRTTGGINIGTAMTTANAIKIGTAATSTVTVQALSLVATTKIASPAYDSSGVGTDMTVGGNLTSGSITMGGVQTTGDINIGISNATGDIYIGNGTNSTTGVNTGICSINKLQVGNTSAGSGVGTGTPYRCMIIGRAVGSTTAATGTITITGAPTTAGNPIVFVSINASSTTNPYFIHVNPTGTNTFTYYKTFFNTAAASIATAIPGATAETFNYVAIWL